MARATKKKKSRNVPVGLQRPGGMTTRGKVRAAVLQDVSEVHTPSPPTRTGISQFAEIGTPSPPTRTVSRATKSIRPLQWHALGKRVVGKFLVCRLDHILI